MVKFFGKSFQNVSLEICDVNLFIVFLLETIWLNCNINCTILE